METIAGFLEGAFKTAVLKAYPELPQAEGMPLLDVTQSTQEKFGHYQFNGAMKLAKVLSLNPRVVAQSIVAQFPATEVVGKLEIAGPGFVNVTLQSDYLNARLERMASDERLGVPSFGAGHRVVVDFSSPNTAKEMHVGHLRSTIIGDALARLLEFLGYQVVRLNHVGDWGTAFGMLIAYLKEEHPQVLTGEEATDLGALVAWYRESKQRFDADPSFKKRSQEQVVALQSGEAGARKAWEVICAISRRAYEEIYDLLDIKLEERGESFYNPMLQDVVDDLERKGLITLSDGAKCLFLEGFINREGEPLPLMVQKSDGGFNYATTDMACIRHRVEDEKAEWIIYVTDAGQATHFNMIFKAAEAAGYIDPAKVRVDHVPFGLVLGSDGKKFRTRSGDTEPLMGLLTTAMEKAEAIMKERSPEMAEDERQAIAKQLGLAAVKYADLSCNRNQDYVFSYDRMLRFEGNTAAFVLYSYVRVAGIKRKVGVDPTQIEASIELCHPSEIALGLQLCQFPEALDGMRRDLMPNRLTDYLYGLAERFNAFFRDCRVEGAAEQNSRLKLCELTAHTLRQGLELLGIGTVERM